MLDRRLLSSLLLLPALVLGAEQPRVILSGELYAQQAQALYTPPSDSSPVVLRYFVADGARVKRGDVVLRIDAGASAGQIKTLGAQIDQARARAAKEAAELRVKAVDAERALVDADAALAKAKIDAAIPRPQLSAIDFDKYQGELQRSTRERELKQHELESAQAAVERRVRDGALEVAKQEAELGYHREQVVEAEVRAETDGLVLHGFDRWRGSRYDEGSSSFPGQKVGEIVGAGPLAVYAYALQPERAALHEGQRVQLSFDAVPQARIKASIDRIGGAPEARAEWGEGRYYRVEITLPEPVDLPLLPGMSVRVEPLTDAAAAVQAVSR